MATTKPQRPLRQLAMVDDGSGLSGSCFDKSFHDTVEVCRGCFPFLEWKGHQIIGAATVQRISKNEVCSPMCHRQEERELWSDKAWCDPMLPEFLSSVSDHFSMGARGCRFFCRTCLSLLTKAKDD